MRVIYLVRTAQLLVTLRALWMLYSVSSFCERTQHTMKACSDMIARIPFATPEQIAEHERIKHLRPASNRMAAIKTTSGASPTSHSTTTTTARAPSSTESSTVIHSTTEETKSRQKRDERRMLPGNGMTEAQRKAAAVAVEMKKEEIKKEEGKKDEVKVEETTPVPSKKEHHDEKKEEKKEEVKAEETTPLPTVAEVKKEDKKEDKKKQHVEKKKEQKPEKMTEVKVEEQKVETTTEAVKPSKNEKKENLGAKIEIPAAPEHQKTKQQHAEKVASGKADPAPSSSSDEKHHTVKKDLKPASEKADPAPSSSSDEKHHTVKKELKAHVQEQTVEEKKESTTRAPKLAPVQERFVLEHADSFLQEVRCLEVTSDDYFGKDLSPFAQHLKGLAFVGPVLVVIAIYLVCTVLRARLLNEPLAEFTANLGTLFHSGMWLLVCLMIVFIYKHWVENWHSVSNKTFMPEFPCAWANLMLLSSCMFLATSIELWFQKRLNDDIVFERSYRTYEVIESDAGQNESQFERTNVY